MTSAFDIATQLIASNGVSIFVVQESRLMVYSMNGVLKQIIPFDDEQHGTIKFMRLDRNFLVIATLTLTVLVYDVERREIRSPVYSQDLKS